MKIRIVAAIVLAAVVCGLFWLSMEKREEYQLKLSAYEEAAQKMEQQALLVQEKQAQLEALTTDFQDWAGASRQINEYIKNKTQGKIVDLFSESDSSAMFILVNYIFFKGTPHPSHSVKAIKTQSVLVGKVFDLTKHMHV